MDMGKSMAPSITEFSVKNAIYKGELTKRGQKKMRPINPT